MCLNGEEGRAVGEGPQRFAGYWKREDETAKTITRGLAAYRRYCASGRGYFIQIVDRIKESVLPAVSTSPRRS